MADASPQANLQRSLLDHFRDRVTPQQFQRWFRSLRVVSSAGGVITIGAPNSFVAEWLEVYYREVIEECVGVAAGPDMRVDIVKDESTAPPAGRQHGGGRQVGGARSRDRDGENGGRDSGSRDTRDADASHGTSSEAGRSRSDAGEAGRGVASRGWSGGRDSGRYDPLAEERHTDSEISRAELRRESRRRRESRGGRRSLPAAPRAPVRARGSTFAASGSDLFGHPRYRNFLSDVILNEDYLFENFVEGPSNQLAHAAATAVSNNPGDAYNPLFLHGAVGLGKTHLLQAICTKYLQQSPDARVIYLSCESFVNQFIAGVSEGQIQDFRYRYRHVDMLLIDDIHFLAKKERTQEEFFHTFNTLYNSKKQIVLSCDSPPVEIPTLEDRLVSRFKWGLVAEIESPDHETRVSIVRKKAERRGINLPDDAALYIADHITANVRELEGAVLRICSYASLSGKPITLELTTESLRDLVRTKERKVSIETILRVVAEQFAVKVSELIGKRRHKSISHPRQIAMYLARRLTQYSLVEIGGQFGGRDHTTVIYANEKIARELETNARLREDLELLVRRIRTGG